MDVLKFPIAKVSICFVAGILFAVYFPIDRFYSLALTALSIAMLTVAYFFTYTKSHSLYFALALIFASISLGILTNSLHDSKQDNNHFLKYTKESKPTYDLQIVLLQRLKPTLYAERYIAEISSVDGQQSSGKVLVTFSKENFTDSISIGSVFRTNTEIKLHNPPLNPDSFDYGKYLATKSIHAQVSVSPDQIQLRKTPSKNPRYYADNLRKRIITNLAKSGFPQREIPIISALFLGQQQDISAEVLRDYQLAGAVHILSVSGLHVGFILLFINFLLKPLPKNKVSNLIRLFITIILLWTFALLAGLSPSVVRSVTMFSFVACGLLLRRQTNIYYILLLSIFVILLVEPAFIFDVGFQLSYTTLFFIIWLQPKLRKIWKPKNKILKYINDLLAVSIAAQLGALPLSIYYFHQFPGLFFVTNLLIIPILTIVMFLGIIVLILAALNFVPFYPMKILSEAVKFINYTINKIAAQEEFLFTNIPFNKYLLITSYLVIVTLILLIYKRNYYRLTALLISIICIQSAAIITKKNVQSTSEFLVFHKTASTIIASRVGQKATIFTSDSIASNIFDNRSINGYLVNNFIKKPTIKPLSNVYTFRAKRILIIDSLAVYPKKTSVDILIITKSAKINFERALAELRPKIVVADGSNYKSQVKIWEATALKQKIPFHKTSEEGFFRVK